MTHRTTPIARIAAVLSLLLAPAVSFAWNATGHKVVALMVWGDLTPTARAKLVEILKLHPRYQADLLQGLGDGASDDETVQYAFATAATWPDMVRGQNNPMHFVANHPIWHYIDIPYEVGGAKAQPPRPPQNPGPQNAVEALTKCVADLKNPATKSADQAIALCWVLHLGGDIHQPLHAVSMYSPQFPDGDQGGNALMVLKEPPYSDSRSNLHAAWDALPGNYQWEHVDVLLANGLRADPMYSRDHFKDALAVTDFMAWAQESHDLAVKYAYLDGKIQAASSQAVRADPTIGIPGLPPGYMAAAERVAMERIALAAYRTADLLNSIEDSR